MIQMHKELKKKISIMLLYTFEVKLTSVTHSDLKFLLNN